MALLILLLGAPNVAFAYVGPGAGITALGAVVAVVAAVFLAIVGFIWYPIKRLRARLTNKGGAGAGKAQINASESPDGTTADQTKP